MDKIRLGNDIEMRWSIFTRDGDNKVPYNLEGRALTLSVVNRTGESEIEFFAEGNIVTGVFRGRDQRILGKHGVILRENNGENGMRTIDACDAFELVACSCEEALGSPGTIQLFHLTFDSTIGAITGTIDPILNYEAEQAEAERKTNEIIRKANEQQRIDNEKQRNVNEILRNIAEEERKNAEQERIVNEDLRKADEAERKTNEESRLQSESERVSSEEERLYAESIRVANEDARIASEAKRAEAETARIEAEGKRIVSEKNRLSAESSRIANEDSRRANEDSRLSAEAKRVSAEEERQAKFASMVVQTTGEATDKVMSQKSVTEALKGKQNKLTAGKGISIDGDVISATLDMDIVRVVDALPSVGEANLIYLVPAEQPSESDLFEEWVWTDRWERIGSAKIDLSDYATKGYVDSKISSTEENLVHKDRFERITAIKQFQKGIGVGLFNTLVANEDGVESGAWLDQNENPAPFIVADPSADDHAATKYYVDEGLATKANIQHQHTVADITDFPELYYDATAFFISGAYPSDKYEELLEAVKAKRTVYATIDEAGYTSYVFFNSSANSDGSSSRVLLTTIFADGGYLYLNTFVLQQSGMTTLRENITGKADKATTLAGYGIGDAYTKSELDALLKGKQDTLTDTDGGYGQRVAELEKGKQDTLKAGNGISIEGNVISSSVAEVVDNIVNAGYVFAGVATPATDPSTPNAKVFYIANGKGTYTNFSGLKVTEDDVVVLYYDTAWHKVSTGIASDEKLSELEDKTLDFSVTEGQGISTSTQISIQKSAGQYVAFELKSDVDISSFAVAYIKPTGGSSVALKGRLRTNTKYYLQLPEDIVSLAVYANASSVKGSGNATFVVYGEIGSVDAKYGQEIVKNNIVLESLIDKKTIGIVSFQNGSYLDQNGELVEDNLGYYSDYIPVTQGDKFKYSGKNLYTKPCIYVILDMYKRVLSYNNNTGTFSDLEVEIEDASAAYIRFGSYVLAPSAERVYLDSTKNYIDEKIADINSKLPEHDVRPKHLYNLFDPSTAIIGKYVKPQDGTLDNSASNVASDYIEVVNGESYSFPVDKSLFGSSLAAQIAMYNASKTFIGAVTGTYSEKNANILTIVINNANCKYIRTTAAKQTSRDKAKWQTGYDTYMVINSGTYPTRYYPYGEIPQYLDGEFSVENNSLVNPLFGKSVIFDGDSICAAASDTNQWGWAGRIANRNRMMWNNFAVGGGTFTKITGKHVISETDYGNANPDYIIIEGGTNDADNIGSIIGGSIPEQYGSYLPTGYTDEFSTSTYCGAIESLFKRLLSTYPKAKIGVIIAQKMGVSNDYTPTGNNRRAYFETLIKLCEKWGIPYINLWDRGRLNPRLSAYYTADDPNSFYTDGQHLTPNGYDVITPIIEEWMKTL